MERDLSSIAAQQPAGLHSLALGHLYIYMYIDIYNIYLIRINFKTKFG